MLSNLNYTYRSPIRYPGGKFYASKVILEAIPYTKEMVSPFVGAAHLELRLACRGTFVHAYDVFYPLINAWNHIVEMPEDIEHDARSFIRENYDDKEAFRNLERTFYTLDEYEQAVAFVVLTHVMMNSILFKNVHIRDFFLDETREIVYYINKGPVSSRQVLRKGKIASFHNPNIRFTEMDFRASLHKHETLFAYCDPPYPTKSVLYGDKPEHHKEFPHEELAAILHAREAPWLLSYNNVPLVRELYPDTDFHYKFPHWRQSMRKDHSSNEVLIAPKGYGLEESVCWQTLPDEVKK